MAHGHTDGLRKLCLPLDSCVRGNDGLPSYYRTWPLRLQTDGKPCIRPLRHVPYPMRQCWMLEPSCMEEGRPAPSCWFTWSGTVASTFNHAAGGHRVVPIRSAGAATGHGVCSSAPDSDPKAYRGTDSDSDCNADASATDRNADAHRHSHCDARADRKRLLPPRLQRPRRRLHLRQPQHLPLPLLLRHRNADANAHPDSYLDPDAPAYRDAHTDPPTQRGTGQLGRSSGRNTAGHCHASPFTGRTQPVCSMWIASAWTGAWCRRCT